MSKKPKKAPKKSGKDLPEHREKIEAKHEFSQDEKLGILSEISHALTEETELKEQAKTSASEWKNRINRVTGRIKELSNKANVGYEMRQTECRVEFDAKKGTKTYYRLEDGVKIDTREMTSVDYELPLFREQEEKNEKVKKGQNIVLVGDAFKEAEERESAAPEGASDTSASD